MFILYYLDVAKVSVLSDRDRDRDCDRDRAHQEAPREWLQETLPCPQLLTPRPLLSLVTGLELLFAFVLKRCPLKQLGHGHGHTVTGYLF